MFIDSGLVGSTDFYSSIRRLLQIAGVLTRVCLVQVFATHDVTAVVRLRDRDNRATTQLHSPETSILMVITTGGLVFKAHRVLHRSTLCSRVTKKKNKTDHRCADAWVFTTGVRHTRRDSSRTSERSR